MFYIKYCYNYDLFQPRKDNEALQSMFNSVFNICMCLSVAYTNIIISMVCNLKIIFFETLHSLFTIERNINW